ncbi:unnamed protein product [Xylocopa violacea]|uniref:Transcription termination factor 5, mitochondrial n=1 Tax=Xylocopa violacea TaxID=135666 RepID=A0ABP1N9W3_XYLVO
MICKKIILQNGKIHDILTTHLKADDKVMNKINEIDGEIINKIPRKQIIRNCTTIKNLDVSLEKIKYLPRCLMLEPMVMRNRILILQEMGVKHIGLHHIFRFPASMRKSITKFKESHDISSKKRMKYRKSGSKKVIFVNNNTRIGDYYKMYALYYKTSYLKLCDELLYKNRKFKYQSFRDISKLLHILKTGFQFDMKFLKKNPYLMNLDVDNVEEFLIKFKYVNINGKCIIEIIRKYPRILFQDSDKIEEFLQLYKILGLSDESIASYINVLFMNKGTFVERYTNITKRHELAVWLNHPRILSIIYNYKTVLNRVDSLRSLNHLNTANINTYLSHKKDFLRFVEGDICHTAMQKFLMYILRKELGEDKIPLINSIRRHPHWKHVSLLDVETMLRYLKKYYTVEDICQNIHIVLYPRSNVIDVLNSVYTEYSLQNTGYNFTSTQYLALCLYKLEKQYHFSGDAIWQTVHNDIFQDIELNESDTLVNYMNDDDNH